MTDIDMDDIRRMDGGLLLIFRELYRLRRTTAAAAQLGLSQSAVSHALSRLRDLFGDPLFLRLPHGLEPTRRATDLAPRIDALIDLIGGTIRLDPRFDPARSRRNFNVAGTEYAVGLIDGGLVRRLRAETSSLTFTYQHMRGHWAVDALRRGRVDLVLGRFESLPEGLAGRRLFEDRYCVAARQGHPTIKGSIDLAGWAATGHVFASAYMPDDEISGPAVGEDPIPSSGAVATVGVVPRWEMALELVAASDAIATCSRRLAEQQAKTLPLQVLELPKFDRSWTVWAVRRDELDPGLDWFCGLLQA